MGVKMTKVCLFLFCSVPVAFAQNLVINGGFEKELGPWAWNIAGSARATGRIDTGEAHTGKGSFRMTNGTGAAPNVYGGIGQTVSGLLPNTKYRISLWCKGQGVGAVWFGGGPGWSLRKHLPTGDFGWTHVFIDFTTGMQETDFYVRVNIDSETKAVWIDDIELTQIGPPGPPPVFVEKGLSSSDRVYPAMGDGKPDLAAPVKVLTKDNTFGGEIRLAWTEKGFLIDLTITDSTTGPVAEGTGMWATDGVQIALDTRPEETKTGYTESCYELGFALRGQNEVLHYAWQAGGSGQFDWSKVQAKGNRTNSGYHLNIFIPWQNLELNPAHLPERLGIDMLFNNGAGGRSYVEWTPGIGEFKNPMFYVQAFLVRPGQKASIAGLSLNPRDYEKDEWITGQYMEYALAELPVRQLAILGIREGKPGAVELSSSPLPKIEPGQRCRVDFFFPAAKLKQEGKYQLKAEIGQAIQATAGLTRKDIKPNIQLRLKEIQGKMEVIKGLLASNPKMAGDNYVTLGLTIAERFVDRIQNRSQSPAWGLLQAEETAWVLDQIQKRIKENTPVSILQPTTGPVTVRNGIFYIEGSKPYYFGGYGHFGAVEQDIPVFWKFGTTLIQQERGPSSMNPDGTLSEGAKSIKATLLKAAAGRIKVDLMLSPHYFPGWAPTIDGDDKPIESPGFIQFNIDHPNARKVIRQWLEAIVPFVKDEPALFSFNLSNEPTYANSGRDKYSRPLWIEYLKGQHKTIEKLNGLYGTKYKSFEEVPVPNIGMPNETNARRAYYDWIIFNQQHFADWHAWMNSIVKRLAPNIPTSSKVMATIFSQGCMVLGTDPELFCRATDLAGNDCSAYLGVQGRFAYDWVTEEAWYDLLHSFRGQPVFNSENHLIPDGTPAIHVPPQFSYSIFWQGALHHQGATTTWVWEEPGNSALEGSIFLRPANIYTAGKAWFDLGRLAPEVAAINADKPRIALLYSIPSLFWQADYGDTVKELYTTLLFMGHPVTFISERQLAEETGPKVDFIILPHTTHVKSSTLKALNEFSSKAGKVLAVGEDCLTFDEYHDTHRLAGRIPIDARITLSADGKNMVTDLRAFLANNGLKFTELTDIEKQKPAWGIEYRSLGYKEMTLVPMINMLNKPQTVKLSLEGKAIDLISGQPVDLTHLTLEPMVPCLLQISNP
jgi:hypothetical protein